MSTNAISDDYFDLDDLEEVLARDYLRVSKDRSGVMRSPAEQHAENQELCERKRWKLGRSYTDEGSASEFQRKRREEFDLLLADLLADTFGAHVLIIWEVSRGTRQAGEMETLLGLCKRRGVWIYVFNKRRVFNPRVVDDWEDLMHAVVKAAGESMRTSERSGRAGKADAGKGRFTGGRRTFGYEADGVTLRQVTDEQLVDEVAVIRDCARKVLGGRTVRSLAGDLNRQGIPTSAGNPWHPGVLRNLLANPRLAGHRTHHGNIAKRDAWPAILDEVTHRRLVATLASQPRVGQRGLSPWVLTGFLRCEYCGEILSGNTSTDGTRRYACRKAPGYKGCGRLVIKAEPTEEVLGDLAMIRLSDVDARRNADAGVDDSEELADLDEIAAMRVETMEGRAKGERAGGLSQAAYIALWAGLDQRQKAVETRLAAKNRQTAALDFVAAEGFVGASWKSLDVDEQRVVLKALVNHVTVGPATTRGSKRFEAERVTSGKRIDWKW